MEAATLRWLPSSLGICGDRVARYDVTMAQREIHRTCSLNVHCKSGLVVDFQDLQDLRETLTRDAIKRLLSGFIITQQALVNYMNRQ